MITRLNKAFSPRIQKRVIELEVSGPIGKLFNSKGWAGFTLPLPWIILIFYWIGPSMPIVSPWSRVHEEVHCFQAQQNPYLIVSWYNYIKELIVQRFKTGSWLLAYRANKYEIEAYTIEDDTYRSGKLPDWV